MQDFGDAGRRGTPAPGLVLLYSETYASLPPVILLTRERLLIGREPPCDVLLPLTAVSRTHAEILSRDSGFELRDLQSRNGVLVNGRRVAAAVLEDLDEIRIGDAIFKFVERSAHEYARYRIDGTLLPGTSRLARGSSALVGGYQIDRVVADLERIAPSTLNVTLLGPTGTGKEVVASELHRLSRRSGALVALNCAAIPGNLLESELFGFKRGAFSGADRDKPGLIRAAHGGTLLLDEIGDMPPEAQAKLLRVIQSKEVTPLGATQPERVDVRFVCATHRDLRRLQHEGRFRADLYARLNDFELRLPPLHARKEDIFALVRAFQMRYGGTHLFPTVPFMVALLHHDWPHNVRELEAAIKRAIALSPGRELDVTVLPDAVREAVLDYGRQATPSTQFMARVSTEMPVPAATAPSEAELRSLLQTHHGNVAAVGRELGKARMQIHRWLRRYGIEVDEYRA